MAEMKLKKTKYDEWVYDTSNSSYFRHGESAVLCNFEGHGGAEGDTVEKLIARLQKLDPQGTVTLDEDDDSGQMAVFVSSIEWRKATPTEVAEEAHKRALAQAEARRIEENRVRAAPLIAEMRRRKKIADLKLEIDAVELALTNVEQELNAASDPIESEDLRQDLDTLAAEHVRLSDLLATL